MEETFITVLTGIANNGGTLELIFVLIIILYQNNYGNKSIKDNKEILKRLEILENKHEEILNKIENNVKCIESIKDSIFKIILKIKGHHNE